MAGNVVLTPSASSIARRPLGLAVIIVLLAVANTFGGIYGLTHRADFFSQFPRLTMSLWNIYQLCPLIGVTAMVAMWFWRRWGFWLACIGAAVVFAIELYVMGPAVWKIFRVPFSLALITFFIRPVWNQFK
jgi:MFS superfamily sulfate permease-like transporter